MKKRPRIDKSVLAIGIEKRVRDKKYLEWVKTLPCCVSGAYPPNDPAHISFQNGKGVALKVGDNNSVPLSREQHNLQHQIGELPFWEQYGGIDRAKKLASDLYAVKFDTDRALRIIGEFRK